jgi:hypothetical protein
MAFSMFLFDELMSFIGMVVVRLKTWIFMAFFTLRKRR